MPPCLSPIVKSDFKFRGQSNGEVTRYFTGGLIPFFGRIKSSIKEDKKSGVIFRIYLKLPPNQLPFMYNNTRGKFNKGKNISPYSDKKGVETAWQLQILLLRN